MNFKKLALVSLASAAVLGAAQTAVHADDANTNTTATSDAVKAAQAKVDAAQTKADAAQAQLTKATTNVATAQATVDSETAGLEQAKVDLPSSGETEAFIQGELNRRTKLVQDAKDDLAAAQTLQAQAQQAADAAQAELTAAQAELAAAQKAVEKPAEETATVKVRVADQDGKPVAGATVEFLVGNGGTPVETGADGYATFTAKKGTEVTARLSKYDEANYTYAFENKELVADDSANNNVALIELTKKASTTPVIPAEATTAPVTVTVQDQDGNAVAGAKVEVYGESGVQPTTDAKGQVKVDSKIGEETLVTLVNLPEGYELVKQSDENKVNLGTLTKDGASYTYVVKKVVANVSTNNPADGSNNNQEALPALSVIRVVDNGHNPVAGAKVEFSTDGFSTGHQVETDENGYATFEAQPGDKVQARLAALPEAYEYNQYVETIDVTAAGANGGFIAVDKKASTTPTDKPVAKDASLTIKVVSEGRTQEGVSVDVMVNGSVLPGTHTTDKDGNIVLTGLKEGDKVDYRVATVPAGYEAPKAASSTLKAGDNAAQITVNKAGSTTPTPESTPAKDAKLTITVVSDGQAREGVSVDVMVNGKVVNVGTTDAKGQVVVNAKEGDKVDYRVASVPAGYEAPAAASSTLKAGDNAAQITVNKAGSTTPTPEPTPTPAAKDATLLITVVSDGQAREGVAVDVMVNGKVVNVGTTAAKGQVIVHAKEGDKVAYRVASVPAGYEAPAVASATLKAGENTAQITVNKAGSTTPTPEPTPTPAAKDATLLITVVSDGQAREGVAVDVMVNGKVVNVGTTDAKGQVIVHAKEGDKVAYRVASVPAGYEAPAAASSTLKAGENTAQITVNKAGSTTPTDNNPAKPETPTEAATFTLSVVDSASKAPLSGVAIDLMVAGKVTTATTDAKGQVAVSAKAGDVVKYRVAVTPAGYKSNTVAYDATLVKGENAATLALEAEGTTPTPTPQPEPQPTPDPTPTPEVKENTTNARYGFYAYEDVNKDGKYYDRFRTVKTYEDIFGNYNYSYVMAMENKKK